MLDSVTRFLVVLDAYRQATGLAEATVSTRIFNHGDRISIIRAGSDVGARKLDKALQWFSDSWPDGVVWPEGIERPAPVSVGEGVS